jgi:hypothetical protein
MSRRIAEASRVGWVLLELLAALAIAIAIVWWTFPKSEKRDDAER